MLRPRAARDADDRASGVHIPVWRAQTGEGRNEVHTAGGIDLARVVFRVAGFVQKAHLVAQPLDYGAPDKHAALERVGDLPVHAGGNGRD